MNEDEEVVAIQKNNNKTPRTESDVGQIDGPPREEASGGREVDEPAAKKTSG